MTKPCPTCGGEMLFGQIDGSDGYACIPCGHSEQIGGATVCVEPRLDYDRKLPHLDRGRQQRRIRRTEAQVEREFDACARARGWDVLSTSRRRKGVVCERCGAFAWPKGGDGVSKGVPDRLLRRDDMPPFLWYGVELKGSHTPLSAEQRDLAAKDGIIIARCYADFEAALDNDRRPQKQG